MVRWDLIAAIAFLEISHNANSDPKCITRCCPKGTHGDSLMFATTKNGVYWGDQTAAQPSGDRLVQIICRYQYRFCFLSSAACLVGIITEYRSRRVNSGYLVWFLNHPLGHSRAVRCIHPASRNNCPKQRHCPDQRQSCRGKVDNAHVQIT